MIPQPAAESPCIGVCTVADNNLCMGCFRTLREIAHWLTFSEAERQSVLKQLEDRQDAFFG